MGKKQYKDFRNISYSERCDYQISLGKARKQTNKQHVPPPQEEVCGLSNAIYFILIGC